MRHVTYNGESLENMPTAAPTDPNVTSPDDRELLELLRAGKFPEAKQRFPLLYNNPHLGFLCQMTGHPAPSDDQGPIQSLTEDEFLEAIGYLEGPTKRR